MCVIIAMENKIPPKETFLLCEKKNPHGGGISWVQNGKVHFKKGIDANEIYDIAMLVGAPCIAHFRISTIGGVPKELCHPFPVDAECSTKLEGEVDSVLFHNGVYSSWETVCLKLVLEKNAVFPTGHMSDSRAMAWITAHCNPSWLEFAGQKTVIQTATERTYSGAWEEKDGVWYSNLNWDNKPQVYYSDEFWKRYDAKRRKIVYGQDADGKTLCCDTDEAEMASDVYLRNRGYNV